MGSSPNWTYGFVPTAAQWNAAFAGKQDDLGYTPVNRAGDTMSGRFVTFASTPARAGFNISVGVAPNAPVDGDVWLTPTGVYAQVNGSTIGPIGPGTVTSVGLVAPTEFTVSDSPVTTSGDITFSWADQSAGLVLAGPVSGGNGTPAFRALVGDDLPDPELSSKGGVLSYTAPSNEFLSAIGADGVPVSSEPDVPALLGYTPLDPANNLSDVDDPGAAAANLGATSTSAANVFTAIQSWSRGADIASAATLVLGTDGNYFHVTGSVDITAISALSGAGPILLCFDGTLTVFHDGASLVLPGGSNIIVRANDVMVLIQDSSGNWRCVSYQPYNVAGWETITRMTTPGATADLTMSDGGILLSAYQKLHLSGYIVPSGGSSTLGLRIRNGTFRTSGYTDQYDLGVGSSAVAAANSGAGSVIALAGPPSDLVNSGGVLIDTLLIDRFNQTVYTRVSCRSFYFAANDSDYAMGLWGGLLAMGEANDGIRLQFLSHNIAAIDVLVEGMRS